jgi:hypothetical protein
MTESARLSWGARRWTAMSVGKSGGQARSDIASIGWGSAPASSSSEADAARTADARTFATRSATAASARRLPSRWWIGAAGRPGSISSIRRRSTTRWSAETVTATAHP